MTKQTLEQQIVAALSDDSTSASVLEELISSTEVGITEAEDAAEAAARACLDPAQSPDIDKAKAEVEATKYAAGRLRTLLPRLQQKASEAETAAYLARWRASYEALKTERDALAVEIGEVYPSATAAIANLFARVADYEGRASAMHQSKPAGVKGFLRAPELVARSLDGDSFTRDAPSLTRNLQLPDWQDSARLLWPPRSVPTSVLVAVGVSQIHDPRRHSPDWAEVKKSDVAARVAEEQRAIKQEAALTEQSRREYEDSLPR